MIMSMFLFLLLFKAIVSKTIASSSSSSSSSSRSITINGCYFCKYGYALRRSVLLYILSL